MIRIYLDWGVISNLKKQEYSNTFSFIKEHKEHLQFPYTPTHFNDLMKSYSNNNQHFIDDLENLNFLADKHLLRWGKDGIEVLFGTPKEYFEGEKEKEDIFSLMDINKVFSDLDEFSSELGISNVGSLLKNIYSSVPSGIELKEENKEFLNKMFPSLENNSSMWDLMQDMAPFTKKFFQDKEYYKDFRGAIKEGGFELDKNAGNWSEEVVIEKIDLFLNKIKPGYTFFEYIETILRHQKNVYNRYHFFTTAYLILDMIGYKSDKLKKPTDSMQNIWNDAEHAFYGAHCDYFVTMDKNLIIKTKVLYRLLNISTTVVPLINLHNIISKSIQLNPKSLTDFFSDNYKNINNDYLIESYPPDSTNLFETHVFKLPSFFLNFFNYVIYQYDQNSNSHIFTYKKVFKNYSNFIYYSEAERIVNYLFALVGTGCAKKEDYEKTIKEFVYEKLESNIVWHFIDGKIILSKDIETQRPLLSIVLDSKKSNIEN